MTVLSEEQVVFTTALEIPSSAARKTYVRTACGDDETMRGRIEALLAAHRHEDGLLDSPLLAETADIADSSGSHHAEVAGTRIDRYTIVEVLGEGGFGIVYKAQQESPIRRLVALKVIKQGMDTEQIVSRFNAERQALALMDHPHIASVYDAGATKAGRPFFVMEWVDGISVTDFCDQHSLTIEQRLRLFIQVCRAIQHAHEKGVIHRDVKPSNVVVTRKDGEPFPKVIDFGIAMAAADCGTEEQDQWAGTPAYMSPEQVVLGKAHVDLRTDVYGLGVLLYELLTGQTPHVNLAVDSAVGISEVRRRIEEDDAPPASVTVRQTPADHLALLGCHRQIEGTKLGSQLRGDLDSIVLKALQRQPRQRYDSVLDFARDIERFLQNEPVEARNAGLGYRSRKFIRRHRVPIASISTIAAILVLSAASLGYRSYVQHQKQSIRVSANREKIEHALDEADQLHAQAVVAGSTDLQTITEAVAAAQRAEALLDDEYHQNADLRDRVLSNLSRLRKEESARRFLTSIDKAQIDIVGNSPDERQQTQQTLIEAFQALGIEVETDTPEKVATILNQSSIEVEGRAVAAIDIWASVYCQQDPSRRDWLFDVAREADPNAWRLQMRKAVQELDQATLEALVQDRELGDQAPSCFIALIYALQQTRSREFFTALHRATDAHPNVLFFNTVLGNFYSQRAGRFDADAAQKSIRYLSAALALLPSDPRILNNLGMNLSRIGDHERAIRLLRKATVSDPDFWYTWHNLGLTAIHCGEYDMAIEAFNESIRLLPTISGRQPVEKLLRRSLILLQAARVLDTCDSVFDEDVLWSYISIKPEELETDSWTDRTEQTFAKIVGDKPQQTAEGSFGSSYFSPQTSWRHGELWLQRSFTSALNESAQRQRALVIRAVADIRVFVDGKCVVDRGFKRDEPTCIPLELAPNTTNHTITVFAKANDSARCLSVDLYDGDLTEVQDACRNERNELSNWLKSHWTGLSRAEGGGQPAPLQANQHEAIESLITILGEVD